jgi:hypothetical protein
VVAVSSNFITGAPPKFEDLVTLRLCMNPKLNDPSCQISKQSSNKMIYLIMCVMIPQYG